MLELDPKPPCQKCKGTKKFTKHHNCKACDKKGRIPLRRTQAFDYDTPYLRPTTCKVREVREMPQLHDNNNYDLYAMVVTTNRTPEGRTKIDKSHCDPLIRAKSEEPGEESKKPYCFPIKITNCDKHQRDKMEKKLKSSFLELHLDLQSTNLTKVERTQHLVVWADWDSFSKNTIDTRKFGKMFNKNRTGGRTPTQPVNHGIPNRVRGIGSSARLPTSPSARLSRLMKIPPTGTRTGRSSLPKQIGTPRGEKEISVPPSPREPLGGHRNARIGFRDINSSHSRRRCGEENEDVDPQKVLPSTLVLRRVKHRRLVVMERLLEEIIAAQNRDRN